MQRARDFHTVQQVRRTPLLLPNMRSALPVYLDLGGSEALPFAAPLAWPFACPFALLPVCLGGLNSEPPYLQRCTAQDTVLPTYCNACSAQK